MPGIEPDDRSDELPDDGLHNDVVTLREDGTLVIDPPRQSIFDCP